MNILSGLLVLSCFVATTLGQLRIVGGHDAPEHSHPYQISLQQQGKHFCSGSILSKRYIMTAAHCIDGMPLEEIQIIAGTNYLDRNDTVYYVESSIIHEEYDSYRNHDIALLRTTRYIEYNRRVRPIRTPYYDVTSKPATAIFSGWGLLRYGDANYPNALQEIFLKLYNIDYDANSTSSLIYTLNMQGEGVCIGDGGGPLVLHGAQIGISSCLYPCARGLPDAYTHVYYYKQWIESRIWH